MAQHWLWIGCVFGVVLLISLPRPAQAQTHKGPHTAFLKDVVDPFHTIKTAFLNVRANGVGIRFNRSFRADKALMVEDGCAQLQNRSLTNVRPFFAAKRTCLGGYAPLVDLVEMDLLDHYDHRFSIKELAVKRPFQARTGMIMQMSEMAQIGLSYTYTSVRNDDAKRFNHMMPYKSDLAGHRMLLRLRAFWR